MKRHQLVDEIRLYVAVHLLSWVMTWVPDGHPSQRHLLAACAVLAQV